MSEQALPDGWQEGISKSRGVKYYVNTYTMESQWDFPTAAAQPSGEKVRVRHLLVKHAKSRRPSSWREEVISRTPEEADSILSQYRSEIMSSENPSKKFEELASKYSDCSSAKHGGDLGKFGTGEMQKAFEVASFALNIGEISSIVSTDSGLHIILRIE